MSKIELNTYNQKKKNLLVPVFAAYHQGSTGALTMFALVRCFAHDLQYKTCHKYVHQKELGKIFSTVYRTHVTGSQIRRYDRKEWFIFGYACFEVNCCTQGQVYNKISLDKNFTKVKEYFVHHIPNNKNLLQFMDMYYYVGDMQWYLKPTLKQNKFCSYFIVLVILVQCHFTTGGK